MEMFNPIFTNSYDPLKAGSIDGTDEYPHDKAVMRAMKAKYRTNKFVKSDPKCTVFVGHLNPHTTEDVIGKSFEQFGKIKKVRIVKDIVTGFSKCYGFIEFDRPSEALNAGRNGNKMILDDHEILVDSEKERDLKGWIPRRLGGGLGGKRESGQLRFGGKERQFRKPILHQAVVKERDYRNKQITRKRSRSRSNERQRNRSRDRSRR